MIKEKKSGIWIVAAALAVLMLFFEYVKIDYTSDEAVNEFIRMILSRAAGAAIFTLFIIYKGYHVFGSRRVSMGRMLAYAVPALLIAINNLPAIAIMTGNAYVEAPPIYWLLFALECIFTGFFEEAAFRGVLLPILLEDKRRTTEDIVKGVVLSSALFGGVHLLNLFVGASPGPVILQVGYSFLIGGMCSIVLLKTKNIWLSILVHSLYNFCGLLVEKLGGGSLWDVPTIVITVILSLAVAVYMLSGLLKIKPHEISDIFGS